MEDKFKIFTTSPRQEAFNNKQVINQLAASFAEFVGKILIERNFFQNNKVEFSTLLYLANDLINAIHSPGNDDFNLYTEINIMYKQLAGIELTPQEKLYDDTIHEFDVLTEIFSGIKYATGFSVLKNLYGSISFSFAQGLTEHIPAILGTNAVTYLGPYVITRLINKLLNKTNLPDQQKNIVKPWLNTVARLAVGFAPRVKADETGAVYQYPSTEEQISWYKNVEIKLPNNDSENKQLPDSNYNQTESGNSAVLEFKLHAIRSITDNYFEVIVLKDGHEKLLQFSTTDPGKIKYLTVHCADKELEQQCAMILLQYVNSVMTGREFDPAMPNPENNNSTPIVENFYWTPAAKNILSVLDTTATIIILI